MNAADADSLPVIETLRARLPAAMRAGQISGAENWLLRDVRTERIFDRAVATLTFTREGHSLRAHLFPTHALANPYARIRHFDLYHLDDHLPDHEPAAEALLDGVLNWLDETLADARDVSFIHPSEPLDPPTPPATASLLAALRKQLPALLATPPLAGWSLTDLRIERFRRLHVPRIDLAQPGQRSLGLFLLPRGTEESCHFRTASFDMVYDDDGQGRTYTRNHETMEHIVAWLDATFPAEAPSQKAPSQKAPSRKAPSRKAPQLASNIVERFAASQREGAVPELADWTLACAISDDLDGLDPSPSTPQPLATISLTRGDLAITLHLLPAGAEPLSPLRTDRFDIVYEDDAHGGTYERSQAALEAFARWLGSAFPLDENELAARRPPRAQITGEPSPLANALDARFREALASKSLPELAGWTLHSASPAGLSDDESPTIRVARNGLDPSPRTHQALATVCLAHDDRAITLHLLPAGTEPLAPLRTDRFDIVYEDDARGTTYNRNRAEILALARWLGDAFPPGESELARRRTQRIQQLQATAEQVALAGSIDARLREAFASESLPELAGWTFLGASPTGLRDDESPTIRVARNDLDPSPRTHQPLTTIRLTRDDRTIALHLLPADTEALASLRTDRFDIVYEDDARGTTYDHNHTAILALARWLSDTFPPGESELARRRTQRLQQFQATAEQVALANSIDTRLREAIGDGSFPLPEGWSLVAVALDRQQGITAPAVSFLHGERAVVLRVLPTASGRATPFRTPRFDVLYDGEPGDSQTHEESVTRGLVTLLETLFPSEATPDATTPIEG
jgi:hypothetical protein